MSKRKRKKLFTFLAILFILIGSSIGYFTQTQLTKNDTFILNGEANITLNINSEYKELGVKAISYGKDISKDISIESNLDTTKEGEYYIIYTLKNSYKYKGIQRVRYISVVNGD